MNDFNCIRATRVRDSREINIKAYLSDSELMDTINSLIDCEFNIKHISSDDYLNALSARKFCTFLESKDYNDFITFIESNNYSVHEIEEIRFKKKSYERSADA